MDMGIDHAGDHHLALGIEAVIDLRARLAPREHGGDLAVLVEHDAGEAFDLPFGIDRHPVDIVDQRIGERGRREGEHGGGSKAEGKGAVHGNP